MDPEATEITWEWIWRILNRCQRHHCSTTYCMRVNKKAAEQAERRGEPAPDPTCRFLFPRPHREEAELIRQPGRTWFSFEAARNDAHMNQFNHLISLCWLANTDVSPCTSVTAVINYAAKYCSKIETQTNTYAQIAKSIIPNVSDRNPMLSFVSKMMNKLIGERDYSAQETCHLLLKLPLQEDSRVVLSVDCRPPDKHGRVLEFSEADEVLQEKTTAYDKYLQRPEDMEDICYFEFFERWNFKSPNKDNWKEWRPPARPRVLYYFPRYKPVHGHAQFSDFCRAKLFLDHPHREHDEFLNLDGRQFDNYEAANEYCMEHHEHEDNHYGDIEAPDPEADEDEFRPEPFDEEISLEDWQEIARMVPELRLEEQAIDLLGRRDIDINYDWALHVGRYTHDNFGNAKYWDNLKRDQFVSNDVENLPLEARETLNPEQRLIYDTIMNHRTHHQAPPILLQVDGGGGTGKSYMIGMLSSHLQQAYPGRKSPILRAAPTGVASNQISGQTLHSLLRLPIDGNYRPLPESPTVLNSLQRVFSGVRYLVIDEKSMLGLKTLGWIDRRLREIFLGRGDLFFGGLSVILIGDFFQLPPVLNKPIYAEYDTSLKDIELVGYNAYQAFRQSVFLETIQRQHGEDQAAFRLALLELRQARVSVESWELLSLRCASNLTAEERKAFADAVRIYPTREKVNTYNHEHMVDLRSPALYIPATHQGQGAEKAESKDAGNLSKTFPACLGARVMLTRNIWNPVGLVNGAQGTVYDIGWAAGADPEKDPPMVFMIAFEGYTGPPYVTEHGEELRDGSGRPVVPILRVRQDFTLKNQMCSRTQFPLVVSYAITVHKSQGVTLPRVVCDISDPEFATGLSYVAVSRVSKLEGLMFDTPFERARVYREPPTKAMQAKMADYERRLAGRLQEAQYQPKIEADVDIDDWEDAE